MTLRTLKGLYAKIMEMDAKTLRRLQEMELELLLEVDRICRKNNIKYTICGGTLLGAVRHKGFIPWDDDADIRMLYTEYKRFKEACQNNLDHQRFFLQDFDSDPKYRWGYAKLLKKGTKYIRTGQEELGMKNGVWIDIFITDGIPNSKLMRILHNGYCFVIRKLLWAPVGKKSCHSRLLRIWYSLLAKIPRSVPVAGIKLSRKLFPEEKCQNLRALTFPGKINGLKRRWMEELTELEFEGHMLYAPKEYEAWLEQTYGDYRKLPPVEERVPHNSAAYYEF